MRKNRLCLAVLIVLAAGFPACAEYTADELMQMTLAGLSYDVKADTAHALGVGRITSGDKGILYARRAAITDAQRGLLILRRGIREGKPPRPHSVSGNLPPFRILSEDKRNGLYFVEIETKLSRLMKEKNSRPFLAEILNGSPDDEAEEEEEP